MARQKIKFQGLPARICWIGLGDRHRIGLAFNEMVANGELEAPIVIGRDHLDSGSVASPNRETEAMRDGSDAVSDRPPAQRAHQLCQRRNLGLAASRRRRRDRLLATCRHGDCGGRNAGCGENGWSACCGTIPRPASCVMPMPATRLRSIAPNNMASNYPASADRMQVVRAASYRRMPWKNGGGETIEMLASPAGVSLETFDWRISMASVVADGPFSSFAGIDRTLGIIDGAGLVLSRNRRAGCRDHLGHDAFLVSRRYRRRMPPRERRDPGSQCNDAPRPMAKPSHALRSHFAGANFLQRRSGGCDLCRSLRPS